MKIRKIRNDEKMDVYRLQSIAFAVRRTLSELENEPEKYKKEVDNWWGVFDDRDKLCGCLVINPYKVMFAGREVKMGGIGGVATAPEERGKGFISKLMRYSIREMYQNNQIISFLYPFSFPFYSKFGYQLTDRYQKYVIPMDTFRRFENSGSVEFFEKDKHTAEIKEIYKQFVEDKNLAIVRDESIWKKWLDKDPFQEQYFIYLWYNSEEKPMGYIIYSVDESNNGKNLKVEELVWLDNNSFTGLLAFIGSLSSQYRKFVWTGPDIIDLFNVFPEPYDIQLSYSPGGMTRIVNVKKTLELFNYPEEEFNFAVKVNDEILEENNKIFEISRDNEGVKVIEDAIVEPDFSCDIREMAQLLTGYSSLAELVSLGKVEVFTKEEFLDNVFAHQDIFINDRF